MYLSEINAIKRKYEMGTVIVLEQLGEDPRPVGPGSKGEVLYVDDIGTVHVRFENGRRMGLVPGEDLFHIENGDPDGDVFRVYPEDGFVEQVYYNPDIGDGGKYVVNFFTFRHQASITGHLVLSSFHADSSAAAFSRMIDLIGTNPIFANSIRLEIGRAHV